MVEHNGDGAASDALGCIVIVCALCTVITRDIGAEFVRIGICGGAIITTNQGGGSGVDSDVLAAICTVCGPSRDGLVHAG